MRWEALNSWVACAVQECSVDLDVSDSCTKTGRKGSAAYRHVAMAKGFVEGRWFEQS